MSAIHSFSGKRETGRRSHVFNLAIVKNHLYEVRAVDTGIARTKMSIVAIFSVVRYSTISLSASPELSKKKKGMQPCQFKYIVTLLTLQLES